MQIEETSIPGVLIVKPARFGDERGFFSEVFRNDVLCTHGVDLPWIQDNHSYSAARGVVRGLHFQNAPFAQAKLVRVVRGAIFDVAVDIRRASPTFGKHIAIELSAANWAQLFIPHGFAHGFCTLSENTEVLYKVTAPYAPSHEGGLRWNDPALAIDWPTSVGETTLNERDASWPLLRDLQITS